MALSPEIGYQKVAQLRGMNCHWMTAILMLRPIEKEGCPPLVNQTESKDNQL